MKKIIAKSDPTDETINKEPEIEEGCVICGDNDEILFEIHGLSKAYKFCLEIVSEFCLSEECYGKFLCSKCNLDLESVVQFRSKCLRSSYVLEKQKQKQRLKEKDERIDLDDPEYDSDALIKEEEEPQESQLPCESLVDKNDYIEIEICQKSDQEEENRIIENEKSNELDIEDQEENYIVVVTDELGEMLSNDVIVQIQKESSTHSVSKNSQKCLECGKEFDSITSYKRHHYRMHRMVRKIYTCTYKNCSETFNNGYRLNVHLRRHQNISFICDLCQKSFYDKAYLVEHVKMVHLKSAPPCFTCKTCGKLFNRKSKFTIHSRIHSEAAKKHSCEICSKKFITKEKLTRHLLVHTDERPFICLYCSIAYKSSYALKKHTIKCS